MTPQQNRRIANSRKALRLAWAGRHNQPMRARIVIRCNVRYLRSVKGMES